MSEAEAVRNELWTYKGRRLGRDDKIKYVFEVEGEENESWYPKQPWNNLVVGGRYEVHARGDKFFVKGDKAPRFLRQISHEEGDLAIWYAKDRAAQVVIDARKAADKAKREKPIGEMTLDEAHEWLNQSMFGQYEARLAVVMGHLIRGGRK